jgi:hypothetical protein
MKWMRNKMEMQPVYYRNSVMDRTGKGARRKHRTDAEDERYEYKGYLRLREAGAIELSLASSINAS